jgi:hypothetical protein
MATPRKRPEDKLKTGPHGPSKNTEEFADNIADQLDEYTDKTQYPMWCEFAYKRPVSLTDPPRLKAISQKFCASYEGMLEKQQSALWKMGLSGKGNAAIVKLALGNNHGIHEIQKQEQVGPIEIDIRGADYSALNKDELTALQQIHAKLYRS